MARFRLLASVHSDTDGTAYHKGDTVESDKPLDKMFVNKFAFDDVVRKAEKAEARAAARAEVPAAAPENKPAEAAQDADGWDDVTDKFKSASDNDFTVERCPETRQFRVRDGDKVLSEGHTLKSKAKVEAFLEKHLGEGDDDGDSGEDDG